MCQFLLGFHVIPASPHIPYSPSSIRIFKLRPSFASLAKEKETIDQVSLFRYNGGLFPNLDIWKVTFSITSCKIPINRFIVPFENNESV